MTDRRFDPSSPCRSGLRLCSLLLLAAQAAHAATLPEASLLAGISGDFRQPALRCEWIAGEFGAIERSLSLYREELASVFVAVDSRTIGDSAGGAVLAVEFDSWRNGPDSMALTIDGSRLPALTSLTPGRRIEAWFTDRRGHPHPLFCGELAVLRTDAATKRTDLLAVSPRSGPERRGDTTYANTTGADVLERLADAAGLALEIQDRRRRTVFPTLERRQLAVWPFMREVARLSGYEIVLQPGGKLLVMETAFAPPPMPSRQWNDVTLSQIANQVAQTLGRVADVRLTAVYPPITITQSRPDEDFLAATAIGYRVSAWYEPGKLMLADDGVWTVPPLTAAPVAAGVAAAPDELQSRITVLGSADGARSFRRLAADKNLRQGDPESIPVVQTTLLLGRAIRAAEPPRFELADYAAIAAALDRAIVRLEQSAGQTAERRFLIGYARSYRPTLIHVYRRMPGGLQALDAIGR